MPKFKAARLVLSALALSAFAGASLASPESPDIRRIGVGETRTQLDTMELKAFPNVVWANLSDFTGGPAVTADSIKNKPVIVLTFSSWTPASQQALAKAAAAADKYAEKGLIVVAVHGDQRFDAAQKMITEKGYGRVVLAKDTAGKFRTGLKSTSDPSVYIIDRAGQLRFASIDPASIDGAAEKVTAETAEAAAAVPGQIAAAEKAARENAGKTRDVSEKVEARKKLENISFAIPSSDAYDKTLWPPKNDPDKDGTSLYANNVQGDKLPIDLKTVDWMTDKPELKGKVVIFDFWFIACPPCKKSKPLIDDIAQVFPDDVAVIAMSGYSGDTRPDIRRYLREQKSDVFHAFDMDDKVRKSLNITAFPHVIVVSTDGVVRWQGNPLDSRFRKVVEQVIANDPGAQNRRKAESEARAKLGLERKASN